MTNQTSVDAESNERQSDLKIKSAFTVLTEENANQPVDRSYCLRKTIRSTVCWPNWFAIYKKESEKRRLVYVQQKWCKVKQLTLSLRVLSNVQLKVRVVREL
jgi:hypothetical protein